MMGAWLNGGRRREPGALPHEVFLRAVYRACLGREPDQAGFADHLCRLQAGTLSWEDVIRGVLDSPEYLAKPVLERLRQQGLAHLHECRKAVFARHVPPADVVVDLGGAANEHPEGALFALGYPHAPKTLIIVDLPPAERLFQGRDTATRLRAARGTEVRYVHGSMTELRFLDEASVDLVVSGQSIEHVTESDADVVCREVWRVLRPGGHFCLDTPNARLTRLQSPDQLIHPEHKREYLFGELYDKLGVSGFQIARTLGVCAMPASIGAGIFDYMEMAGAQELCTDAESGYAIYIDAIKCDAPRGSDASSVGSS